MGWRIYPCSFQRDQINYTSHHTAFNGADGCGGRSAFTRADSSNHFHHEWRALPAYIKEQMHDIIAAWVNKPTEKNRAAKEKCNQIHEPHKRFSIEAGQVQIFNE